MEKAEVTIIGAGAVGLAVAQELSKHYKDIFVIEKEPCFGCGASSRNSEVIHAGIYYPRGSLKAKTCIEGQQLLYDFCAKHNINHKRIGKFIVAINEDEIRDLEDLYSCGCNNGSSQLKMLSKNEVKQLEPNITAEAAIYSPSTGIFDSHSFMKSLSVQFEGNGGTMAYNTEVTGIDKKKGRFEISVQDNGGESFKFSSRVIINCAGLNSDKIAAMLGIIGDEYKLKYCKGDYFRVHHNKARFVNRLIYPVPKHNRAGLGIHATLDLAGGMRLGPDDEYTDKINYDIDASKAEVFYESVRGFLPFVSRQDISPDTSGIRPKLQGRGEAFRDFIIKEESQNMLPDFINLVGIESPGLTASLSIAGMVKAMVRCAYR